MIAVKLRQSQSPVFPTLILARHCPCLVTAPAKSADKRFYDLSHPECLSFSRVLYISVIARTPQASSPLWADIPEGLSARNKYLILHGDGQSLL